MKPHLRERSRGAVVNMLVSDIVINKFEVQLSNHIPFQANTLEKRYQLHSPHQPWIK